jgi:ribosomal protein S18 acetylase RimI-like enzyme
MPSPSIRPARLADAPEILRMMRSFSRAERIPFRPRRVAPALRRLLRASRLGLVLVAEDTKVLRGGRARARASVTPSRLAAYAVGTYGFDLEFAGPDAFVTELFVEPRRRGRGLGARLLEALVSALGAAGAGAAHLLVWPDNRIARRLYERAGFTVVPRVVMTRRLPSRRSGPRRGRDGSRAR